MTKNAFTLIEVLIVLGISAILVGISAGVYMSLNQRSGLDTEARKLESVLNLARSRTLASEGAKSYGVHFATSTNSYVLFEGASFDPSNPQNETFVIPSDISLEVLELFDGGEDVVFERLSGATEDRGSILLESAPEAAERKYICIDASGALGVYAECEETSLEYTNGLTDADLASFPDDSGFGDPAQSFTVGPQDVFAHAAELYIRRTSSDPSDIYLEIRQSSTVGNVIGRSLTADGASLSPTLEWFRFVFSDPVFLEANTQYFLRMRSLPDSTVSFSGASGFVYWGYEHAPSAPPAYGGGDAWRYAGRSDVPSDEGEQLGPADQYDFSFRIRYGITPPQNKDSRHMEFDLEDSSGRGWTIQGGSTLTLVFHDTPNPDVEENIAMADYFSSGGTVFDWKGNIDVNGDTETLRIHSHYIDENDTTLSMHRDQSMNQKAVDISIDGKDIVSYAADGTPTAGAWGGVMTYR